VAALTIAPTTDLLKPAASPWMAAVGFTSWQIGMFVITAFRWRGAPTRYCGFRGRGLGEAVLPPMGVATEWK
jgi:hypothetical protein